MADGSKVRIGERMRDKYIPRVLTCAAFLFYLLITCYKLTDAPLWFDETIEYWFSRLMKGSLPFVTNGTEGTTDMYHRILTTYQPPLYNVLMFFWLKISESEWWFRFFGVLMGLLGNIAVYRTVKRHGSEYAAALAVFFSSCIYISLYYMQECSEYCLMLGTLSWTIYYFFEVIRERSTKNIVLFTVSSILPVYSQYGAAFPVAAMLFVAYVYVLTGKERKAAVRMTASYLTALVVAAIPLIVFFLAKQMAGIQGEAGGSGVSLGGNIVVVFFKSFITVIWWSIFGGCSNAVTFVIASFFLASLLVAVVFSRKMHIRLLVAINAVTWIVYFIAVRSGLYSYGMFGNRYNLFFIPLWVVTIFLVAQEIPEIARERLPERFRAAGRIYCVIGVCLVVCFMYSNWHRKIRNNRTKEDMRGAVAAWVECGAKDSETIVYYAGDSGFAYYVRHADDYREEWERNVRYMAWESDLSKEGFDGYLSALYGEEEPQEIYVIGSHIRDDLYTMLAVLANRGYTTESVFSGYKATLVRLRKNAS